jgi:hypothetical protein
MEGGAFLKAATLSLSSCHSAAGAADGVLAATGAGADADADASAAPHVCSSRRRLTSSLWGWPTPRVHLLTASWCCCCCVAAAASAMASSAVCSEVACASPACVDRLARNES